MGVFAGVPRVDPDACEAWHVEEQRKVHVEPLGVGDDQGVPARGDGRLAGDLLRALHVFQGEAKPFTLYQQLPNGTRRLWPAADEAEVHCDPRCSTSFI